MRDGFNSFFWLFRLKRAQVEENGTWGSDWGYVNNSKQKEPVCPNNGYIESSLPRLLGDQSRDGRTAIAAVHRAPAAPGLLPAVRQPRSNPPPRAGSLVSQLARRRPLHLADRQAAAVEWNRLRFRLPMREPSILALHVEGTLIQSVMPSSGAFRPRRGFGGLSAPPRSRLGPRGELDWIVMKCLEKDQRRLRDRERVGGRPAAPTSGPSARRCVSPQTASDVAPRTSPRAGPDCRRADLAALARSTWAAVLSRSKLGLISRSVPARHKHGLPVPASAVRLRGQPARPSSRLGTEIGTGAFGTEKRPGGSREERDITPGILITYKRRGWDSNPRYVLPYTAFPVPHLWPLGHLLENITRFAMNT